MKNICNNNAALIFIGFIILSLTIGYFWSRQVHADKCASLADSIVSVRDGGLLLVMQEKGGRPSDDFFGSLLAILESLNGVTVDECGLK